MESAWEWNLPMRMILDQLLDKWFAANIGIDLPGVGLVNHLLWADNVYFLSHSRADLETMLTDFSNKLYLLGLRWKESSLEFLHTNGLDNKNDINICARDANCVFKFVSDLNLLGSKVSLSNLFAAPIEHRFRKSDSCFWSLRDVLLAKDLLLTVRFENYVKQVQPVSGTLQFWLLDLGQAILFLIVQMGKLCFAPYVGVAQKARGVFCLFSEEVHSPCQAVVPQSGLQKFVYLGIAPFTFFGGIRLRQPFILDSLYFDAFSWCLHVLERQTLVALATGPRLRPGSSES